MNPQTRMAEFAVIVTNAYLGHRQYLMERLITVAVSAASTSALAEYCAKNQRMFGLMKGLGFRKGNTVDRGVVQVVLEM
jgi:hypothetical protein